MGTRIRVLHCIQNLNYGGMERVLTDLVRGVDHDVIDPHVLTLEYRGHYGEELDDDAVLHDGPRQSRWAMVHPRQLTRAIATIRPDVVHLHSGVWFKAARASRQAGVRRVIYTEHGRSPAPEPWSARLLDGFAARITDRIVAVSEATAVQLQEGPGVGERQIEVIPNGVDTRWFAPGPSSLRADLGLSDDTILIGSVGRLEPVKGYDLLLRALRQLLDRTDLPGPVRLVLAGDGSQRKALQALARSLDLSGAVTFLGWRDDAVDLLRAFDIFTLTSVSEGTSVSLLEAMGSGCCPVVTAVGGNARVLGDDLSHRLVTSRDPRAVANGLAAAVRDVEQRRCDGRRGRERVCATFALQQMVDAYARLYTDP